MGHALSDVDPARWIPGLAWAAFAYGFHKVGARVGWYLAFPWFQNLTHAASASGVAILVGLYGLHRGYRGRRLVLLVVGLTALGAVGWEVVEYFGFMDRFGYHLMFHDFEDAAVDMVSNAVGTTAALLALYRWTGLEPVDGRSAGEAFGESGSGPRLRR